MSEQTGLNGHDISDPEIVAKNPCVCVFTASAIGNDPDVPAAIEEFAEILVANGYGAVYGGGDAGNMGKLAYAMEKYRGELIGIMPPFLEKREGRFHYGTHIVAVDGMHKRKRLMFKNSCAFVAFPGGLGTLEELAEMMTWEQLGQHGKPVVLANINGFWDPLIEVFHRMIAREYAGYLNKEIRLRVANTPREILPLIRGDRECTLLRVSNGIARPGTTGLSVEQLDQM